MFFEKVSVRVTYKFAIVVAVAESNSTQTITLDSSSDGNLMAGKVWSGNLKNKNYDNPAYLKKSPKKPKIGGKKHFFQNILKRFKPIQSGPVLDLVSPKETSPDVKLGGGCFVYEMHWFTRCEPLSGCQFITSMDPSTSWDPL